MTVTYKNVLLKNSKILTGTAYEASAYIIDGYGASLAKKYAAARSNRDYILDINADTGSTDLTGDTMDGAIRGRVVIGTTQSNASIYGVHGNIDVGASKNIISNYAGIYGVVDFYGASTIGGSVTHVAGGFFTLWCEGVETSTGAGNSLSGIECILNGTAPTMTGGINAAVLMRGQAAWQWGIYAATGMLTNGISMTLATLNATTGRLGKFYGSIAAGNLGDGYGAFEVDLTMTGTQAGHVAAFSSWLNMNTGTLLAGALCAAASLGIYEDSAVVPTNTQLIFGARMSAIIGDTTGWQVLAPFSLNTGNLSITCLFHTASAPAIGYVAGTPSATACGSVPFFCDVDGSDVRWVRIYPSSS